MGDNHIYSVIRRDFTRPKLLQICKLILCRSAIKLGFLSQNNTKDTDPSRKDVMFGSKQTDLAKVIGLMKLLVY